MIYIVGLWLCFLSDLDHVPYFHSYVEEIGPLKNTPVVIPLTEKAVDKLQIEIGVKIQKRGCELVDTIRLKEEE